MNYISNLIIPIIVIVIIIYGYVKKVDVYDAFIEGVKSSFGMINSLFPTFIAMILAINIFISSDFIELIFKIFKPIFELIKLPIEVFPIALIRPISSSASLAYLNNIFVRFGPDSFIGLLGSVMQSCTDTTFYIITLYLSSVGIKKIRYSLIPLLISDLIGIVSSIFIVNCFFN